MIQPNADNDITLITVSGEDKPGISSLLLGVLAEHDAIILDIGQAVIHETLSLGILVQVPDDQEWNTVSDELFSRADELGLKIKFNPVTIDEYGHWVAAQGKERHIITVLGQTLSAKHLARLCTIIHEHDMNIMVLTRLSGRIPVNAPTAPTIACVEISVRGTPKDAVTMRGEFLQLSHEHGIDIAFQIDNVYRRNRRLVVFDMDSTLIQAEVIDELAVEAGIGDAVAKITERAMRGEIDFRESLSQRLALLKGLDASVLDTVYKRIALTDGAEKLISMLKHLGYKVALISGGFTYFAEQLKTRLGIDYVYAHDLEIIDNKLTGNITNQVIDGDRKADILREIAEKEGIVLEQVIAVGDGANDLPMLSLAGLGIAFQAKSIVRENAEQSISTVGLDGILYLIGVRNRETLESLR
ncbi:phosphoserine phosphatase SerB [bacterium AH-315-P07]|nr:phosphoserine phosphatase SerB [bacterium AH-315-P07]